jgi:hypothetical protein
MASNLGMIRLSIILLFFNFKIFLECRQFLKTEFRPGTTEFAPEFFFIICKIFRHEIFYQSVAEYLANFKKNSGRNSVF